jgi:hypothetical protein
MFHFPIPDDWFLRDLTSICEFLFGLTNSVDKWLWWWWWLMVMQTTVADWWKWRLRRFYYIAEEPCVLIFVIYCRILSVRQAPAVGDRVLLRENMFWNAKLYEATGNWSWGIYELIRIRMNTHLSFIKYRNK